jgi:hypothetical protein
MVTGRPRAGFKRRLFGRPFASNEEEGQLLPKRLALPVFASDPLSSVAYATEEAMLVLSLAGAMAFNWLTPLSVGIATLLLIVIVSYRQTNPDLLERVVANLLENALVWSPPGQAVRISAGEVAGCVDLRISDRGPGIPADMREIVLLPFQRFGDSPNRSGVGLGPAVARGLLEAMGSELVIEDTPGEARRCALSSLDAAESGRTWHTDSTPKATRWLSSTSKAASFQSLGPAFARSTHTQRAPLSPRPVSQGARGSHPRGSHRRRDHMAEA